MNKKFDIDYGRLPYYIIIGIVLLAFLILNYIYLVDYTSSNSEAINDYSIRDEDMNKTRTPAVAGLFYPADVYQLSNIVDEYLEQAPSATSQRPQIIIVPHAGYQYSAQVAASAYKKLVPFAQEIKKVIVIGPSHRVALQGAALSSATEFSTPLGKIPTDSEITTELSQQPSFKMNDKAHAQEHSLEVQLPFLQKTLKKFTIVPLVYGNIEPQVMAEALKPFVNRKDVLIVISADLSHYLDYDTAKIVDGHTAGLVERNQQLEDHLSCGATGINTALLLAKDLSYQPKLLDMANSGDVTGERSSVVGYAAWLFEQKNNEPAKKLTPLEQEVENLSHFARHHGAALLQIAAHSLRNAVAKQKPYNPSRDDFDDVLFNKGASFVTLTKNGELRGCIGTLVANRAVSLDVAANAFAAAMKDDRFSPVTAEELPQLEVSISLLSDYEQLHFKTENELLQQITAGIDGVVIRDGNRQGLFLPSVWKQVPGKEEFLRNLKLKAGLSPSYWSDQIKAYRFRVVEIKKNEN